jgi:hypothetical protein
MISGLITALLLILARLALIHTAAAFGHIVVALALRRVLLIVAVTAVRVVRLIAHDEMISE